MAGIITGKDASFKIAVGSLDNKDLSFWGVSDMSLSFSRDIVEQELVGQTGNLRKPGKLSVEGSFTNCKIAASGNSDILDSIIDPENLLVISGQLGSGNLRFYFVSCQVTSFEVTMGDASTISEASIDFTVLDPYNVTYSSGYITDT